MAETTNNIKDFKTLAAMEKIRVLVKEIYRVTKDFPPAEKFCAVNQMRRAVTSIGANVAEGNGQMYPNKEVSFLNNAIGSLSEIRYWILFSLDMGYISEADYNQLEEKCIELVKMLHGCVRKVKQTIHDANII